MQISKDRFLLIFVILSIIGIIKITPNFSKQHKNLNYFRQEFVEGKVVKILSQNLMKDPVIKDRYRGNQEIIVKLLEGDEKGKEYKVYNSLGSLSNTYLKVGDRAVFTVREKDNKKVVWFFNLKRDRLLYILGSLFALGLLIFGRMKGIQSLLALCFTGTIIIWGLIPIIFAGYSPILWSVILMGIVTVISFLLIGGFERKTYVAILGTIGGIIIAGLLTLIFGGLMSLSGINMSGGEQLLYIVENHNIKVKGLLFASILIASLGAIMDVSMSISSAGNELYVKNSDMTMKELFISLMNIGKDIMGTMTNTLILAFTGSSLPLIMMIWGYDMKYQQFINIPAIAIEIMQGLAGSIGIIATVPLTALITIIFIKKENGEDV